MNQHIECPHCGAHHHLMPNSDFDGMCSCGEDVYEFPDEYIGDAPEPGDIYEVADGLQIITPAGTWTLLDEEVLNLITGLSTMLHHRLSRPFSAENGSTILTRGRITAHFKMENQ